MKGVGLNSMGKHVEKNENSEMDMTVEKVANALGLRYTTQGLSLFDNDYLCHDNCLKIDHLCVGDLCWGARGIKYIAD